MLTLWSFLFVPKLTSQMTSFWHYYIEILAVSKLFMINCITCFWPRNFRSSRSFPNNKIDHIESPESLASFYRRAEAQTNERYIRREIRWCGPKAHCSLKKSILIDFLALKYLLITIWDMYSDITGGLGLQNFSSVYPLKFKTTSKAQKFNYIKIQKLILISTHRRNVCLPKPSKALKFNCQNRRNLRSSPGPAHCAVFLGKTLESHSASLQSDVEI